jgi:hypothetical protein
VIVERITIVRNVFWLLFLTNTVNLVGCANNRKNTEKEAEVDKTNQSLIVKPGSSFNDTLVVNTNSAVLFTADSVQFEKFRKVVSPMAWESIHHDCYYQMRYARTVLKGQWPKIEIKEAVKKRYILFVKSDGKNICIDTDKMDVCGILLFNKIKNPQPADLTNIETELRYYFESPN